MICHVVLMLWASVQAYDSGCTVSSWGPWSDWLSESHDPSISSFPVEEKSGAARYRMEEMMRLKEARSEELVRCRERPSEGRVDCVDGFANDLECWNIDQISFLNISMMHYNPDNIPGPTSVFGNDNWGWTDPDNGDEYALMGLSAGTSFIRITDPENPEVVGHIETQGKNGTLWRDMKVIDHHAYIVSEEPDHGMQVFDLHRLRGVTTPTTFQPDAHYDEIGNCHNIVASEETGYVYPVACDKGDYPNICQGGLHVVNVQDPLNPTFEGCFGGDGYVHDAQCLIYRGPDTAYYGRELCFCYNEDDLTILDVDDKANMMIISRTGYNGSMYTHQGWLTEDESVLLMDDELDERDTTDKITKTYIWDVQDLTNPILMNTYRAPTTSIDHNQYVVGNYTYQANMYSGLRILSIDQANYALTLVGYFDVLPGENVAAFGGAWNCYPYFNSGNLIVSTSEYGLFTLRPDYAAMERVSRDKMAYTERRRYREILSASDVTDCPMLVDVEAMVQ